MRIQASDTSLQEGIISGQGIHGMTAHCFHRTGAGVSDVDTLVKQVQAIVKNGFNPGSGNWAGTGLYMTGDKNTQMSKSLSMASYGLAIIRYQVNLKGVLFFDYAVARKAYGSALTLEEQLNKMGFRQIPPLIEVLSEDLSKTLQSGNARLSADRAKNIWADCFRTDSSAKTNDIAGNIKNLWGISGDPELRARYMEAIPSINECRKIAQSGKITGIAFTGGHDGNVIVIYGKNAQQIQATAKPVAFCITNPKDPTDSTIMLRPWEAIGKGGVASMDSLLADNLEAARFPHKGNTFDEFFFENVSKVGVPAVIDFIKQNFQWLGSRQVIFRGLDVAFSKDKKLYIFGGVWAGGDCHAEYFGPADNARTELSRMGKTDFSGASDAIFRSGTFKGSEFSGIMIGGIFASGIFNGLFRGGVIDIDAGAKWGAGNILNEKSLIRSIKLNGKVWPLPPDVVDMDAFIRQIKAGITVAGTSKIVLDTDDSLSDIIERTLPFKATVSILDDWRGKGSLEGQYLKFKDAYPWMFNKHERKTFKDNVVITVTNEAVTLSSGTLFMGNFYFDAYSRTVVLNGGIVHGKNEFMGIQTAGIYREGTFKGVFKSGIFNLDKAVWDATAEAKPDYSAKAATAVIFKDKTIEIIPETFFIPDKSGKAALWKNFREVLEAIKTGEYQRVTSQIKMEIFKAQRGKGSMPKLLSKANQYLKKLGAVADRSLGDDDWHDDDDAQFMQDSILNKNIFGEPLKEQFEFWKIPIDEQLGIPVKKSDLQEQKALPEKEFYFRDLTDPEQDMLYQEFRDSYTKATGAAFDRDAFEWRADNWTFYGEPPDDRNPNAPVGGIAVRKQPSGLIKLVASFGHIKSIMRGFDELKQKHGNSSIWGMVSDEIRRIIIKRDKDFRSVPGPIVKAMEGMIKKMSNGEVKSVGFDGAITVNTPAGPMKKYFIANRVYLRWLVASVEDPKNASRIPIPQAVLSPLISMVKALI